MEWSQFTCDVCGQVIAKAMHGEEVVISYHSCPHRTTDEIKSAIEEQMYNSYQITGQLCLILGAPNRVEKC